MSEESTDLAVIEHIPALSEVDGVGEEGMERLNALFQSMAAQPKGFEEELEWRPEKLRLRHPITNDSMMPSSVEIGDLYSSGKKLWSYEDDGRKNPFEFVVCYMWMSRARFQPGDKMPDCSSADRVWNDEGTLKCENCPDLPFRDGKPTNCNDNMNMLILPLDLSGVYLARFSKTSLKAGRNITKMLRGVQNLWDKTFGLTTKKMSNGTNEWFVYQSKPLENEPPKEVKLMANYICDEYSKVREEYLEQREQRRKAVNQGIEEMEDEGFVEIDDDDDDAGFSDTM